MTPVRPIPILLVAAGFGAVGLSGSMQSAPPVAIEVGRVPNGGLQPEVATDPAGRSHIVYLTGEPGAADVFYVRSDDGGRTFSPPIQVNSVAGSAVAAGTIRGAQIAVGRNGSVHVAWNGSTRPGSNAGAASETRGMPMLYARLPSGARTFEPQRNLMTRTTNLDGGGAIAADGTGAVFVAWHGNDVGGDQGEATRRVWLSRSLDDGLTFEAEQPVSPATTGACGCCGMRLAIAAGHLQLLYRAATNTVHRDVYSLLSRDRGKTFSSARVHPWEIGACPMTSMSIAAAAGVYRAWETDGEVYVDAGAAASAPVTPQPRAAANARRKHPRLVAGGGAVVLVWTEGTTWGRGGSIGWQTFDNGLRATSPPGRQPGLPAWSFAAVLRRPDGGFTILY
jgi:hypothetical protein